MYWGNERRGFRRLKVNFFVQYSVGEAPSIENRLESEENSAITIDLSEGGVTLIAGQYVPANANMKIKFITSEGSRPARGDLPEHIMLEGAVVSVIPLTSCRYRLGISFGEITEEIQSKFFDLICCPEVRV